MNRFLLSMYTKVINTTESLNFKSRMFQILPSLATDTNIKDTVINVTITKVLELNISMYYFCCK